jgi:FKBP-type peptidyl-prolyl cis-trans isomerase
VLIRFIALGALVVALAAPGFAAEEGTADEETMYALGVALTQSLQSLHLQPNEVEQVAKGLRDGLTGKAKDVDLAQFRTKFQELAQERAKKVADAERKASEAYLAKAAQQEGAVKTDSGLIYLELVAGTGASPTATDKVKVHYHGTLIDGTVFDSSVERKQPASFRLNGVIKCWTEGVQKMKVGGKSQLICPSDIAYGDRGSPPKINPGATLVFEVELLEIEAAPAPAPAANPAP